LDRRRRRVITRCCAGNSVARQAVDRAVRFAPPATTGSRSIALRPGRLRQVTPDSPTASASERAISARFGIDRRIDVGGQHRRWRFRYCASEEAAQHGDVSLSGRGGRLAELKPAITGAFDRFLADAMSGHNLLYRLAKEQMAKA
jgi:hypothetical protein